MYTYVYMYICIYIYIYVYSQVSYNGSITPIHPFDEDLPEGQKGQSKWTVIYIS